MPSAPAVYVITGPMAAGKSTVAGMLVERFDRGVHVEGDVFRRFIRRGRTEMTPELTDEAFEQLRLRYRLAANAADTYHEAGFTVVVDDVAAGRVLGEFVGMIVSRPLHVVVLLPTVEALKQRDAARVHQGYGDWSAEQLHGGFLDETPRLGLWLDTTEMTAEETVDAILAQTSGKRAT